MNDQSSQPAIHVDKYNDPRVKITRRGILMGVGVLIFAIIGAGLSIYIRKTPLEESTKFWGPETITALQLAERIELFPRGQETFDRVELTTTPGLGLLRRTLLDSRNFDWPSEDDGSVASTCGLASEDNGPTCIQLRLTDPTGHRIGTIEIDIDLDGGWVGPSDGAKRVRAMPHLQPKLKNYFATVINVKQKRYDLR